MGTGRQGGVETGGRGAGESSGVLWLTDGEERVVVGGGWQDRKGRLVCILRIAHSGRNFFKDQRRYLLFLVFRL